jgi:hypothetical protein
MEEAFGSLENGARDTRDVVVSGQVLTARRLGNVLFLSFDNVTAFTLFSPDLHDTTNDTAPPTTDIFAQYDAQHGEQVEISLHSVLQVILTKEDFKGEIRENNGEFEINESLKELSRTIAMGHTVGILKKKTGGEKKWREN